MPIYPPDLTEDKLCSPSSTAQLRGRALRIAALSMVIAAIVGGAFLEGVKAIRPHGHGDSKSVARASNAPVVSKIASLPAVAALPKPRRAEPGAPLDLLRITSDFGMRLHPILGLVRMHEGVDFGAAEGAPVLAAADGVVTDAGPDGGYGNFLRIRHAGGWSTGYAHLSAFAPGIGSGTRVRAGQVVAFVGHTGLATGPHLHFEVSLNGIKIDPMSMPAAQIGGVGPFHWKAVIGQSRGIELASRTWPSRIAPVVVSPVTPVAVAVEGHETAPARASGHDTISLTSTAQAEQVAFLTSAPAQTFTKQSYFSYAPRASNHLPLPGS